ncbi:MAG: tripartite tricarboxylate transporter TctB family protein [Actinomycetota bacterium]|nr:tripartite tricarboxylate transporter TctB family protein [Actinomycetota bacterium]
MSNVDDVGPGAAGAHHDPDHTTVSGSPLARRLLIGVGVVVTLMGAGILSKVGDIRLPKGYTVIGPRAMPTVVGVALVGLGIAFTIQSVLRRDAALLSSVTAEHADGRRGVVLSLVVALVLYTRLLVPVGYVVTTIVFLPVAARILGSRSPLRDVTVGACIAVAAYECFTRLLDIRLPAGVLGDLL